MTKKGFYWLFQISGWGFLIFLGLLQEFQVENSIALRKLVQSLIVFCLGIGISHLYRYFIIHRDWLSSNVVKAIPRIIFASIAIGTIFYGVEIIMVYVKETVGIGGEKDTLSRFFGGRDENMSTGFVVLRLTLAIINNALLFFIWSVIYFGYHFFERSRQQEIERLQWAASINETELNNLKAQLNPHFMFNAMNSIRALVEEDPVLCKKAITQLSNLLRNTLQTGKRKVVLIEEEMKIVKDYLALEKIRYEERLNIEIELEDGIKKCLVPPLLLQTLVENAIKHGISMIRKGGTLRIAGVLKGDELHITILNDGKYNPKPSEVEGIGLKNSTKRLEILYGDRGSIQINNVGNQVETRVIIPKEKINRR
ncbi:MAG: histidine kinase [Flavobacteriales bacterium]|nr:histidine kinase [Flavobacteriales bacterium]